MARKRISEFRAKTLLAQTLDQPYNGISVTADAPMPVMQHHSSDSKYVVKVDQGVKGRFKKGLVLLDQTIDQVPGAITQLHEKGYNRFLVEHMTEHLEAEEQYVALERTREGIQISYSKHGGIDIESHNEKVITFNLNPQTFDEIAKKTTLSEALLIKLYAAFNSFYLSFLEINPFIIHDTNYIILDAAIEVDSTAEFFVNDAWTANDITDAGQKEKTPEEEAVQKLAAKSQAAFSLEVLHSDGSIFMMLSGGGASIVLADEVYNQGFGKQLANYGEYSGNPNAEETYLYAKSVLSLMLKSKAQKKALIIAGGVANFTDVRVTFNGLIKALDEMKKDLQAQNCKVFVRRGGPYQEEGLQQMKSFLEKENLLGIVEGPEMVLTDIVTEALKVL
jgi:succinyl-CoA synthetase beta subunit